MVTLLIFFATTAVISLGILIWLYTKSGKKWLENL